MELTKTVDLLKPLADHEQLNLREPMVDEFAAFEGESLKFGRVRAFKNLLAKISEVEVGALGQLGARDLKECQRFVDALMDVGTDELLEGDEAVRTLLAPIAGLTSVKLREPTLDEIARMATEGQKLGQVVAMRNAIAVMNKTEPKTIGRMGLHDFKVCDKYLEGFFD